MENRQGVTVDAVIERLQGYQQDAPVERIRAAYQYAQEAHEGQLRASGEPYIAHPLSVAQILTELQVDGTAIIAALLHDVVEDTTRTLLDVEKMFGKDVALLVDGVTKLSRIEHEYKSKEDQQLENYRKMFLAMAKDIRVVLIKLADRMHNMRTLRHVPEAKQRRIAQETLEIFAPLAHRLGIFNMKWELEDLAFRYLEPEKYYELVERVKQKRKERQALIDEAVGMLKDRLTAVQVRADIQGRPKHFYSIFRKMQKDNRDLSEIYDLLALRILVDEVKDCYGALGIVHTVWKPMPGRFKDYIAMPKSNLYQSLHTTVIGPGGQPLEIQIRTRDMHQISEYGIAAHWRYKEGGKGAQKNFDSKMSWLRQLLEWQQDLRDPHEFMESIKLDVFADEVFVFTPKGDVVDLPAGSVPIDFAYRIHTDVGHRCVGAKVNGKLVPLEHKLTNGDIVEVMTSKNSAGPSRDWLNIVASSDTRNKIRQWFKKVKREENVVKGREMLEREARKLGYDRDLFKAEYLQEVVKKLNMGTDEDLFATLGFGGIAVSTVLAKLIDLHKRAVKKATPPDLTQILAELKPKNTKAKSSHGILVEGEGGLMVRMSRCCNPVRGDMIVGYITRGRGISVHRADCPNVTMHVSQEDRMIDVHWDIGTGDTQYKVSIEVNCLDRPGVLSELIGLAAESKINISAINAKTLKSKTALINLVLEIMNLNQLEHIMTKMRRVKDVYSVYRSAPISGSQP